MVKFCKDGSDATSGAVRLARAYTGRDIVACCVDHPFFSTDDWFIGTTPMNSGVPVAVRNLTVTFRYNDIASVRDLFDRHSGQLAALILEPSRGDDPREGFLHEVQRLCRENGALLIFDEMITGFRWHAGGAQKLYGVEPDLSAFGKALGNGFSVSAYAQRTCCVAHRRAAQDSEPGTRSACLRRCAWEPRAHGPVHGSNQTGGQRGLAGAYRLYVRNCGDWSDRDDASCHRPDSLMASAHGAAALTGSAALAVSRPRRGAVNGCTAPRYGFRGCQAQGRLTYHT